MEIITNLYTQKREYHFLFIKIRKNKRLIHKHQRKCNHLNEGITMCLDTYYDINSVRQHNCFYYTR